MTRINARQRPRPQQYAPYELYTHTTHCDPRADEAPHERTSDVRTGGGVPRSPAIFGWVACYSKLYLRISLANTQGAAGRCTAQTCSHTIGQEVRNTSRPLHTVAIVVIGSSCSY